MPDEKKEEEVPTCSVCGMEVKVNETSGKVINHYTGPGSELCEGSNVEPAGKGKDKDEKKDDKKDDKKPEPPKDDKKK